jgi:hypothetical protein
MIDETIYIQIASYRDPELIKTLQDCIDNANRPENLRFGICKQYCDDDDFNDISEFEADPKFKVINVPWKEARGVCWARNLVQNEYGGEMYTLQIDSHHRFVPGWDTICIDMVKQLQKMGYNKPLLTGYIPSYEPWNDPEGRQPDPWYMEYDRFIPEGAIFFLPSTIADHKTRIKPMRSRFYSAHFCFTLGKFCKEVSHDPDYYFHGEEISIAVRAYTHGYDLFHPHKVVCWHEYTRQGRNKHWEDHDVDSGSSYGWCSVNNACHLRNRTIFGMDETDAKNLDFGKFGFGSTRTVEDYERYAGIKFDRRGVLPDTWPNCTEPPSLNYVDNPDVFPTREDWLNGFGRNWCVDIWISKKVITTPEHSDCDFWCCTAHDKDDNEIYREDLPDYRIKEELEKDNASFFMKFVSDVEPRSWRVLPHSKSKGWLDVIGPVNLNLPHSKFEIENNIYNE